MGYKYNIFYKKNPYTWKLVIKVHKEGVNYYNQNNLLMISLDSRGMYNIDNGVWFDEKSYSTNLTQIIQNLGYIQLTDPMIHLIDSGCTVYDLQGNKYTVVEFNGNKVLKKGIKIYGFLYHILLKKPEHLEYYDISVINFYKLMENLIIDILHNNHTAERLDENSLSEFKNAINDILNITYIDNNSNCKRCYRIGHWKNECQEKLDVEGNLIDNNNKKYI